MMIHQYQSGYTILCNLAWSVHTMRTLVQETTRSTYEEAGNEE